LFLSSQKKHLRPGVCEGREFVRYETDPVQSSFLPKKACHVRAKLSGEKIFQRVLRSENPRAGQIVNLHPQNHKNFVLVSSLSRYLQMLQRMAD
jgi:hypothetical protein